MASYPKWQYHPTKPAVVVADEAAHKALGPEWADSPAAHLKLVPKPEVKTEETAKTPVVQAAALIAETKPKKGK